MIPTPEITTLRPLGAGETIFLIGPGGVGKSTLGVRLERLLGYPLIDLDLEFCRRIAIIGPFITQHGYDAYRAANLALARKLVDAASRPSTVVTSSGFLAAHPDSADYREALALIRTGFSIRLLPSMDVDEATEIVVGRQLARGFGLDRETETRKFRTRFVIYRDIGDMRVASALPPDDIARAVFNVLRDRP